jgi:4a-hydroxytetrahydrobiopterin dehydratase
MAILSSEQIAEALQDLAGWKFGQNAISKQFAFPDFKTAMFFVNTVAGLAELADHHPDILVTYKRVTMTLSTHSAGGVTSKDVELAKQIERAAA